LRPVMLIDRDNRLARLVEVACSHSIDRLVPASSHRAAQLTLRVVHIQLTQTDEAGSSSLRDAYAATISGLLPSFDVGRDVEIRTTVSRTEFRKNQACPFCIDTTEHIVGVDHCPKRRFAHKRILDLRDSHVRVDSPDQTLRDLYFW